MPDIDEKDIEKALGNNEYGQAVPPEHSDSGQSDSLDDVATGKDGDLQAQSKDEQDMVRQITTNTSATETNITEHIVSADQHASQVSWYHKINPLKRKTPPPVPTDRTPSRERGASLLSLLTFQWMNPVLTVGFHRPLELNDIWLVNPDRATEVLTLKLMASFKRRVAAGERHPLVFALHETFKAEFWWGGLCALSSSVFQVMSPFVTRYLIEFAGEAYVAQRSAKPAPNIGKGIGIVLSITFMQICQSLATNQFAYHGMMVGGQARAALIDAIFDKTLKISGRAKAGGQAMGDEKTGNGIDLDSLKADKAKLVQRIWSKRTSGPQPPPHERGTGVAGDGSGWSNGKIVNLMSVDTYRVDLASGMFHFTWTSPILVIITLILLCINIGYSALSGYALLVIGMPLLTKAIKSLFVRRRKINKLTDQRVTLTQEVLASVRFVKFFGWEGSFLERLKELRRREIKAIQVLLAIRNAINAVSMSLPNFASMLSFITYSLSHHSLVPGRIFSSLALFNALRLPLNLLPLVLSQVTDAVASVGRIQEFLLTEEQRDEIEWDEAMTAAIETTDASFTWERTSTHGKQQSAVFQTKAQIKDAKKAHKQEKKAAAEEALKKRGIMADSHSEELSLEPFKLKDISFTAGRNELLAVIGTVGSGKSSLLAALAGDMRRTAGQVKMGTGRAFCPQYAWIQNSSFRDNILFGKPYVSRWYNQVIDACALRPDLEMLPAGDRTEIGERGITLSGGQKQRLNIARAMYFDADIVLMDDPLSAVDAHVGRHIMDQAICGIMRNKCRILATHQLHVLSRCDRIVWMDEGRIESIDTFANLMKNDQRFQHLMARTAQEEATEGGDKGTATTGIDAQQEDARKNKKRSAAKALMQQEERAVKAVGWGVYAAYMRASGSVLMAPLVLAALVLANCANIATSLWLSYWTSNKFGYSSGVYIGVYTSLGLVQALLMYAFSTLLSTGGTNASKAMLQRAMTRVLRAPMSFFDTTPLGRITNRFSKDIDSMDNTLTDALRMYLITMTMIVSIFALIIAFFPYFAIALVPLLLVFVFSAGYYRASAREIKRHEAVLRSTLFARFGEAVTGIASIRAYGLQKHFSERIRESIDDMDSAYFLTFSNQRWLAIRLDAVGNLLVFTTGMLVVTSRFNVSPSIAGLVLSYILATVQIIQFSVKQMAEVENTMNATERLHYYGTQLEEEAPATLNNVDDAWPRTGQIVFQDVELRYRAGLPLVLRSFNLHVAGGERIGIVGRTGAGKSSIMAALFRLTELAAGSIKIDDVDISTVGLHELRSRLAIIPQDPTLFRGTIRSNLDPFNEHSDLELWAALRKADLVGDTQDASTGRDSPTKSTGRIHLDSTVEEEGLNFSLGQRQLMALARAVVRDSRIIVCDEATSSVDFETDRKIQRTIATGFQGKTLLCIAHRLKTIIGYDRICVMDAGGIAELGEPIELYDQGGIFRSMCERSGIRREDFGAEG